MIMKCRVKTPARREGANVGLKAMITQSLFKPYENGNIHKKNLPEAGLLFARFFYPLSFIIENKSGLILQNKKNNYGRYTYCDSKGNNSENA
jgi:hypothetical protein